MPHVDLDLTNVNWSGLLQKGQTGSGTIVPFIAKQRYQRGGSRGRGIGGILATILRLIPTFLASPIGTEIARAATGVVTDVKDGKTIRESVKEQGRKSVRNLSGLGAKRRVNPIAVVKPPRQKRTRTRAERSLLLR